VLRLQGKAGLSLMGTATCRDGCEVKLLLTRSCEAEAMPQAMVGIRAPAKSWTARTDSQHRMSAPWWSKRVSMRLAGQQWIGSGNAPRAGHGDHGSLPSGSVP
jgi:hypothetical protein